MNDIDVTGSCLCKSVKYRVTAGSLLRFSKCHCSRCRKLSGTGHASNILLKPVTAITWLEGEELLKRYKVPEAERFYNCFCRECGSPMPRVIPQLDAVLIPAGSLDSEPGIKPQHHIFWDSRAEWESDEGELPVYSEYPV